MIILNHIESASIEHGFRYWGESLNYSRNNTFNLRGRIISDQVDTPNGGEYFGVAYAEDTNIWYPLGANGASGVSGLFPSGSGQLVFDPSGNAVTEILGLNVGETFGGSGYHPYYDIWTEMDNIRDGMNNFQEVIVDGVSIGSGRVTNIGFPESRDPRKSLYEVTVETYSSGDFNSLVSNTFDNVNFDAEAIARALSIDESLTSQTDENGNTSFNRSLSISLINDERPPSGFIDVAKGVASGIIKGDPNLNNFYAAYPSYYENQGRRISSESYDSLNGSFSFSEKYLSSQNQDNYAVENSRTINLNTEGVLSYTDQGSITLNRLPFTSYADDAYNQIKNEVLSGASGILNDYYTGCPAQLFLESSSRNTDLARGVIGFSFNLSNDPFSSGGFRVTQTNSIEYTNGVPTVSEQGTITTSQGDDGSGRLNNAVNHFRANIEPDIYERAYGYYTGSPLDQNCQCDESGVQPSSNFVLKESSDSYSEYVGQFGYSRSHGIECSSVDSNNFVVTRERNIKDTTHKVFLGRGVNVGEIAQKQNQSSLVAESQSIMVQGKESGRAVQEYVDAAVSGLDLPNGVYYAEGLQYSFNPVNLLLSLSINFNYSGFRAYDNIDV